MAHRVNGALRHGDNADADQERYGQGEAREGEGRSWHWLEHGMGASGGDREDLAAAFSRRIAVQPAKPAANPYFRAPVFGRNI
jgi:hypothetical protein